jgi:histidyl-tRNA synthetase
MLGEAITDAWGRAENRPSLPISAGRGKSTPGGPDHLTGVCPQTNLPPPMAKRVSTKPPSGMRDFLPEDLFRRQFVVDVVREVYERYGFVPLETPSIENLEILTGKYGEDEKLIYRILHRGEALSRVLEQPPEGGLGADDLSDQALRYDLTVPLARVVAQYGDLPKFFKRYQIQPVWRADRPGRGRFREFFQCDVDITGTTSLVADAEVCAAGCEVLRKLGFDDFDFAINHRELLRSVIRTAGIDTSLEGTALVAVDKLDKIGSDGVLQELEQRGIGESEGKRLLALIQREGDNASLIEGLRGEVDEGGTKALDQLAELFVLLEATPVGSHVRFAPQLARGLSYYTGPIFEVSVPDLKGSIAGGGRYDGLVGLFGKQQVPAVGLALGLERILVVMTERGMYPELSTGAEVMVCWRGVASSDAVTLAHRLRAQGLKVEIYPEPTKLAKQIQYADASGVKARFVAILGEDELKAGEVTLKNLGSGEQVRVAVDAAAATVRAATA